ncbi:MAG: peptide deformylase [Opitutaceae bacterium]|jgi:peptide deformylase
MPLRIVHYNSPILRKKGRKVTAFDAALAGLVNEMVDTMHAAEGIGLAAQQVGLDLQVCVMDLRPTDRDFTWSLDGSATPLELIMPMALINPEVTLLPSPREPYNEGCLSFPEIRGDVVRPTEISVRFQDVHGTAHELKCSGLFARCVQHEVDHLNGTLFIDRMDKKVRAGIETAVRDLGQRTRETGAEVA